MTETHRTDVLIVGAGPTGLALAIGLQQKGIDHIIIDKEMHGHNTSRAAVIHAHTLEMLEELGVSKTLAADGLKLAKFTMRDHDRALLQLRFDGLPSAYNYLLMTPPRTKRKRSFAIGWPLSGGASGAVLRPPVWRKQTMGRRRKPSHRPATASFIPAL